ncbi:hypothetical protein EJ08DRAFT_221951 [Tothia fuscella]|uniref:Uncharacterized protein n=1 Tax=Tothia fuscella TaxID=1048955 RepID=A0A9P4P2F3_9PEZI|nr:hypothetical protein EJ08DRAFT_221951 [Tothia fuscella]
MYMDDIIMSFLFFSSKPADTRSWLGFFKGLTEAWNRKSPIGTNLKECEDRFHMRANECRNGFMGRRDYTLCGADGAFYVCILFTLFNIPTTIDFSPLLLQVLTIVVYLVH